MVHEVDIIYNQLPGKLPTLNSSELMADNVRAAVSVEAALLRKQPWASLMTTAPPLWLE